MLSSKCPSHVFYESIGTLITIRGTKMGIPKIGICTSRIPNIKMGIAATHMIFFFSWESEVLGKSFIPGS